MHESSLFSHNVHYSNGIVLSIYSHKDEQFLFLNSDLLSLFFRFFKRWHPKKIENSRYCLGLMKTWAYWKPRKWWTVSFDFSIEFSLRFCPRDPKTSLRNKYLVNIYLVIKFIFQKYSEKFTDKFSSFLNLACFVYYFPPITKDFQPPTQQSITHNSTEFHRRKIPPVTFKPRPP